MYYLWIAGATEPLHLPCSTRLRATHGGKQNETTKGNIVWLATVRGFYSVVRKGTPPNNFQVRARTRKDIENLCDLIGIPYSRIVVSHDSDYEFRVKLDQSELGVMGAKLLDTIRYENFKQACSSRPDQQKQCDTYHRWWSDHARWQEHPPYSGVGRRGNGRNPKRDDQRSLDV